MVKTIQLKIFIFTAVKNPCILHRRVFVMFGSRVHHVNTHIQHTTIFIACNYPNLFIRAKIRQIRYTSVVLKGVVRWGSKLHVRDSIITKTRPCNILEFFTAVKR